MEALAPKEKNYLKEGSTQILNEGGYVFYNPVQEFNRDLSITVLSTFSKVFLTEQNEKREKREKVKGKQNAMEKPTAEATDVVENVTSTEVEDVEAEPITVKAGEKLEVYVQFLFLLRSGSAYLVVFSLVWLY